MRNIIILAICFLLPAVHAQPNEYTVNAGDILEISVWKEENLNRELRVLPDGSISFPLIGVISVSGKPIKAIQAELTKKLSEYITDPIVNIFIKSVEGNSVYVLGKVQNPGMFVMHQPMDILQILSLSGGLVQFAKENDILIFRREKDSYKAIEFEYGELKDGDDLDTNFFLKSGDVIVVP